MSAVHSFIGITIGTLVFFLGISFDKYELPNILKATPGVAIMLVYALVYLIPKIKQEIIDKKRPEYSKVLDDNREYQDKREICPDD